MIVLDSTIDSLKLQGRYVTEDCRRDRRRSKGENEENFDKRREIKKGGDKG